MAWRSSTFCRRAAAESAPNAVPSVTKLITDTAVRPFMTCLLCCVSQPIVIIQLLAHQVFRLVVFADVLHQLFLRGQVEFHVYMKRLHKGPWILESNRQNHLAQIHTPVAFSRVQHLGVGHRASTDAS